MAYKFTYMTLQHSGTRFFESYFIRLGFSPLNFSERCGKCGQAHGYRHQHISEKNKSGEFEYRWRHYSDTLNATKFANLQSIEPGYPVISTLRHPYKVALSFLNRGFSLNECVRVWDAFIETSTRTNIVYCDPDCKEEYRKSHLRNILLSVDCYKEEFEETIEEFANEWKPLGVWRGGHKYPDSELPDMFDWGRFDRAVNWYNKTLLKCKY